MWHQAEPGRNARSGLSLLFYFAVLLADKTNKDLIKQKKHKEGELQKAIVRGKTVAALYEKVHEDNVTGKVTDEEFIQPSHKYGTEKLELKTKIAVLRQEINELEGIRQSKEQFISTIRKFMQMETLTAPLLKEPVERIDVYEIEGTGKNRTQCLVIHYKFVGYINVPEASHRNYYEEETRKGMAVKYIPKPIPA